MNNIKITQVTTHDISQLQMIGRQTFYETFSESNTEENMKNYLEEGFSDEKLQAELSDESAEFYFSKIEDEDIGYLKLNFGAS